LVFLLALSVLVAIATAGFYFAGAFWFLPHSLVPAATRWFLLALVGSFCHRYRGFGLGLYFLFSLTPVRGGTYFLCCAKESEQRKALHPQPPQCRPRKQNRSWCDALIAPVHLHSLEHQGPMPISSPGFATSALTPSA
jgi:hypothetical protein